MMHASSVRPVAAVAVVIVVAIVVAIVVVVPVPVVEDAAVVATRTLLRPST